MTFNRNQTVTAHYVLVTLLAVIVSFLLHEFLHWLTGQALGYHMVMTLNKAYPGSLSYTQGWHYPFISAVGPLVTLVQALTVFLLLQKTSNKYLYPFLFAAFYLELLSGVMNIRHPNDLGRIGQTLGLGLFVLPIVFVAIHFFMVRRASLVQGYSSKFIWLTLMLVLFFSSIWILANQRFHVVLLG
ncbi:MAG: hypothetical protein EOP49_10870 [Sphingobacteriales bacterium]|nr:MAG: hypothetical protein EOP49_10870 [Sphingobacteriales bacterium]